MTNEPVTDALLSEFLIGLGWSHARRMDPEQVILAWSGRGYDIVDAAIDFVTQFDGISFEYPRHPVVGGTHECVLDAIRATGAINPTRVQDYEQRIGRQLAPVGLAASNHVLLMIAASGEVFGGYDDFLGLYGNDGKAALWNIYHRIDPVRLPRP